MKLRKEIEQQTLEELREKLIAHATENQVFLSALKRERLKSGNTDKIDLISEIRKRESSEVSLENDIKLVEEKINEFSKPKSKSEQPKTNK